MSGQAKSIQFHFLKKDFLLSNRTLLKQFIVRLARKEGHKVEHINYIFCSDNYLHQINKQYLNHDTYTDIVTFQFSSLEKPIVSDIYISIDRVRENAKAFKTSFTQELLRVIFHGALHLCGYRDKTAGQIKQMRESENSYLQQYAFHVKRIKSSFNKFPVKH